MLVILPIRSLLLYTVFGMSTYSMFTFLLTASPLELQFLSVLLNMCSVGIGLYIAFQYIPQILKAIEDGKCTCGDHASEACEASETGEDFDADTDTDTDSEIYIQQDRVVQEKDGKLVVTITYVPVLETDESEEVREMVEKSPQEESPTEETTEFAELLKKDN
jgi:hypothetical protein